MGFDYAFVHLVYTIPPAIGLTIIYRPFLTVLDLYKICFLLCIAVAATTPWDSYLIRNKIWTYPPNAIIGPTLFRIPAEELFFFVIQTYTTSILYLLLSKPTFFPAYLRVSKGSLTTYDDLILWKYIGQISLTCAIISGAYMIITNNGGTYLGLIFVWAGPFLLFLWSLAYQLIIGLPLSNTVIPIAIPTMYLWIVDTIALKRGTWVIESGTKFGYHLWDGLEIEEAIFFLLTNALVVFGLVAFDNSFAILESFPSLFPNFAGLPSPTLLVKAFLIPTSSYDAYRIKGFQEALKRLREKSRSFYLASGVFHGRLRIDLILLYSFCRVGDDLVDNAANSAEAQQWIDKLTEYLHIAYSFDEDHREQLGRFVAKNFPSHTHTTLILLPVDLLPSEPLYALLDGFRTDLQFSSPSSSTSDHGKTKPATEDFPIRSDKDLLLYGSRVAGTVAELCLHLVYHHTPFQRPVDPETRQRCLAAGSRMGIALQFVNIARDIATDAADDRVYLPSSWLAEEDISLTHEEIIASRGQATGVSKLRRRLLERAMKIYEEARGAIDDLPVEARGPMRVAVESYIEIGRVMLESGDREPVVNKKGKATVPKLRRLWVGWRALCGPIRS